MGWGGGGGGDSRDGTAIITDLLEEISTTQTGCPHHIEMIDSGGECEWGMCVCVCVCGDGLHEGGEREGVVGNRRRAGGGARQLAPHLAAPFLAAHTHLPCYPLGCVGMVQARILATGFNQYTSLVKDGPSAAAANTTTLTKLPRMQHSLVA